jgi:hypothetical protein
MPQCGQMRTRAQSGPPFHTPKHPTVPGIFRKSSFCHRTQAPRDQNNTHSFPGFRTPPSRVSALQPAIAQHECTHTLSGIPVHEPGRNKKSKKCETNRTQAQENSQAANPAPASVFIRGYPWQKNRSCLNRLAHLRSVPEKSVIGSDQALFPVIRQELLLYPVAQSRRDPSIQQKQNVHAAAEAARHQVRAPHIHFRRAAGLLNASQNRRKVRSMSRGWLSDESQWPFFTRDKAGRSIFPPTSADKTEQQVSLTLINVSARIKRKRKAHNFHTIG